MNRYLLPCEIYTSKVFGRLRNKTQLFNSRADDHFHTRLIHSIEVEYISSQIVDKLTNKGYKKLNKKLVTNIALLHDIGHTPFGHAGERALNDLCSGSCFGKINLPDFKKLNVQIGFKHNINSALIYVESFPVKRVLSSVAEGIIYHSKLFYSNQKDLDYGIGLIINKTRIKINYSNPSPKLDEHIIVAYADEIAQVASDITDLTCAGINISAIHSLPYVKSAIKVSPNNTRNQTRILIGLLINCFVDSFLNKEKNLSETKFCKWLSKFDEVRRKIIDSNRIIKDYDKSKTLVVNELFSFYFYNPEKADPDLLDSFINRIQSLTYNSGTVASEIRNHNCQDKQFFIEYLKRTIGYVDNFENNSCAKNLLDDYRKIYKMFIRSVAIHISKMTDGYADHKCNEILNIN